MSVVLKVTQREYYDAIYVVYISLHNNNSNLKHKVLSFQYDLSASAQYIHKYFISFTEIFQN
jgi:hypothetical protein